MNTWHRSYTHSFSNKKAVITLAAGAALLVLSFVTALLVGAAGFNIFDAIGQLISGDVGTEGRILLYIRLPRALAACLAGAALAVSGAIIQAVLNNAMASPSIIGVNAGAGFGVSLLTALAPAAVTFIPATAFVGASLTGILIYLIASKTGASRMTITLTGIAVRVFNSVCTNHRLVAKFFKFVSYELNFCSNDNLYACFTWTHNASYTCGFDFLFINFSLIFDFKTKSCDAVVN